MSAKAKPQAQRSTSDPARLGSPAAVPDRSVQLKRSLRGMDFASQEAALAPAAPVQMKAAAVQMEDDGESWIDSISNAASGAVDSVSNAASSVVDGASAMLGGGGGGAQASAPEAASAPEQAAPEGAEGGEPSWFDKAKEAVAGVAEGVGGALGIGPEAGGGEQTETPPEGQTEGGDGEPSWWDKAKEAVAGAVEGAGAEGAENASGDKSSLWDRFVHWLKGEDDKGNPAGDESLLETWLARISDKAAMVPGKTGTLGKIGKDVSSFAGHFRKLGKASGKGSAADAIEISQQVVACGSDITGAAGNIAGLADQLSKSDDLRALEVGTAIGKAKERLEQLDTLLSGLDLANEMANAKPNFDSRAGCIEWAHQVGNAFKAAGGVLKGLKGVPIMGAVCSYMELPATVIEAMIPVFEGYWKKIDDEGHVGQRHQGQIIPEGTSAAVD